MKKFLYILALPLMIGFTSCETIVELDLPEHKPVLVANSIFTADSSLQVKVTHSISVLDNGSPGEITNATVEIYKDGNYLATLVHKGNGIYSDSTLHPAEGSLYALKVSAPNYEAISASSFVPYAVPITSVTVHDSVQGAGNIQGNSFAEVSVTFTDPSANGNYYYLEMLVSDSLTGGYNAVSIFPANENSSSEEVAGRGVLLSDELINGKTYTFKVYTDSYNVSAIHTSNPNAFIIMRLRSVTKDYYLYKKTYELQQETNGNPFAEPVQVYNNVEGGFGMFTGYSSDTLMVK